MLDNNMPSLKASYQLERSSTQLQAYLNEIHTTRNIIRLNQLDASLDKTLDDIDRFTATLTKSSVINKLRGEYQLLGVDIDAFVPLLSRKIQIKQELDKISESVSWLHQDIVDEVNPLRQEIEWQITSERTRLSSETKSILYEDFTTLQMMTLKENELVSLVNEVIRQYKQRNLESAFHFISYKTDEIARLSEKLEHNAASITYRQLLLEFFDLVKPDGKLYNNLKALKLLNEHANQQRQNIQNRLEYQQQQIKHLVSTTSVDLSGIKLSTRNIIEAGNVFLLLVLTTSILLSALIYFYFVRKRIVQRLYHLSLNLNSVATGETNRLIPVTGNDEIGLLGKTLNDFCFQLQEVENTNALNLINNTQASLVTCSIEGVIESMNSSARHLFSLCGRSFENEYIWSLFDPRYHFQLRTLFASDSALLLNGAYTITLEIVSEEQQVNYFRLDLRVYYQNTIPKIIITLTDITEQANVARWLEQKVEEKTHSLTQANIELHSQIEDRKRAEATLVATQEELIQAAKMAVVGQAMTTLAHELNQPLSALSTYIYTVQMTYNANDYPDIYNTMAKMDEISDRMEQIITNLRGFSKKTSFMNPAVKVNLHQAVNSAIGIADSRAKQHNINLCNQLGDDCCCVGDLIQIEQVIVNLLINSCDALAPVGGDQGVVTLSKLECSEHSIVLACSDNGPGFDPAIINQIFTPFTTTKEVGLGLGLNICHSIMARLNGSIQLASTLDGGAMIVLEFPIQ
ncbi:ATP-binding protein [Photobacterium jeanii]|nr:ATP-binding protein [Photobacterium jeanii]